MLRSIVYDHGIHVMSAYPHKHDNAAPIYKKKGLHYVTHADLIDNGYEYLEDFSIIYINGEFWELQAHVPKVNAWWIERVPTEGVIDELPPQAEEEAAESA